MNRILIIGGSGFIGQALYRELAPFYSVHATYAKDNASFEKNQHFHQFDFETEEIAPLLDQLKPRFIVSAIRGNVNGQLYLHQQLINWVMRNDSRILFLSSANVFDRFTNYPSYEYDKTFSESIYGRFKIKIENALLRLPNSKYVIARIPMIFGAQSPKVKELKKLLTDNEPIEVFPNVVINATYIDKLVQQLHYIINRRRRGVFHLGSSDLIHHSDLYEELATGLGYDQVTWKHVFDSNEDRQLSVLPKDNLLPRHLQFKVEDVVAASIA
ncbi:dTDP-4-dehydrorhamnose reductase [Nonlabens spongiae]|uniref:dTDP-4-dehydrorhamnose reductase n=1 Tax=Nonlabens spongiae TaxID=331648 RepID=A0A1W6MHJ5_9FLAO|nr:sugar nucleotide-binding protein [Nonlabens spongiae]ARN77073.1 dTDP-4-dehydrorhamnose reductase [Nonlabens spongiae]